MISPLDLPKDARRIVPRPCRGHDAAGSRLFARAGRRLYISSGTIGPNLWGIDMQYQGLLGLLVLIADVWAIIQILQSGADSTKKLLWVVVVILLPLIGLVLWYFIGPRNGRG